jgi:perosamine synthetase
MMKNFKYSNNNSSFIPYGHQWIDEDDIQAVVDALRSDWITTGPKVSEFEKAVAEFVGVKEAVAVSSGTAALHAAMYAIGIEPGDEVILPPMTFAATANAVVFQGGTPVFADVDPETLLIDPAQVEAKISSRTKAIIAVDYAGQPCDYDALKSIADKYNLFLIADACHSLGAVYKGRNVGTLADLTIFSFHPVKHITTGEGGMVVTDKPQFAKQIRLFRNHGINIDFRNREKNKSWLYEIVDLGYNFRLSDIQCALGISQLKKLPGFLKTRREIAKCYNNAFEEIENITPLLVKKQRQSAYHLYVVKSEFESSGWSRSEFFMKMHREGIGVNVHYIPVHMHPFYRKHFKTDVGLCPIAESVYEKIVSLPIFPQMTEDEVSRVIQIIRKLLVHKKIRQVD